MEVENALLAKYALPSQTAKTETRTVLTKDKGNCGLKVELTLRLHPY